MALRLDPKASGTQLSEFIKALPKKLDEGLHYDMITLVTPPPPSGPFAIDFLRSDT